jgi:hypothetical protein
MPNKSTKTKSGLARYNHINSSSFFSSTVFEDFVTAAHEPIGPRLLKNLGWKTGGIIDD